MLKKMTIAVLILTAFFSVGRGDSSQSRNFEKEKMLVELNFKNTVKSKPENKLESLSEDQKFKFAKEDDDFFAVSLNPDRQLKYKINFNWPAEGRIDIYFKPQWTGFEKSPLFIMDLFSLTDEKTPLDLLRIFTVNGYLATQNVSSKEGKKYGGVLRHALEKDKFQNRQHCCSLEWSLNGKGKDIFRAYLDDKFLGEIPSGYLQKQPAFLALFGQHNRATSTGFLEEVQIYEAAFPKKDKKTVTGKNALGSAEAFSESSLGQSFKLPEKRNSESIKQKNLLKNFADFGMDRPALDFNVIADPHIRTDENNPGNLPVFSTKTSKFKYHKLRIANSRMRKIIEEMNESRPDMCFVVGDMIFKGSPKVYSVVNRLFRLLRIPCYFTPGNHETGIKSSFQPKGSPYSQQEFSDEKLRLYKSYFGSNYYSLNKKGYHFIVLDSAIFNRPEGEVQKKWLIDDLENNKKAKGIFVFFHVPLFLRSPKDSQANNYEVCDEPARSELAELFSQYKVDCVYNGHIHFPETYIYKGVKYVILPSTSFFRDIGSWHKDKTGPLDPGKIGYVRVRIYNDGTIVNEFVNTVDNLPPALQMQKNNESFPERLLLKTGAEIKKPLAAMCALPQREIKRWHIDNVIDGFAEPIEGSHERSGWTSKLHYGKDANEEIKEWFIVNLGKEREISRIEMLPRQGKVFAPENFKIYFSDDKENWREILVENNYKWAENEYIKNLSGPEKAKYVKCIFLNLPFQKNQDCRAAALRELRLIAPSGKDIATLSAGARIDSSSSEIPWASRQAVNMSSLLNSLQAGAKSIFLDPLNGIPPEEQIKYLPLMRDMLLWTLDYQNKDIDFYILMRNKNDFNQILSPVLAKCSKLKGILLPLTSPDETSDLAKEIREKCNKEIILFLKGAELRSNQKPLLYKIDGVLIEPEKIDGALSHINEIQAELHKKGIKKIWVNWKAGTCGNLFELVKNIAVLHGKSIIPCFDFVPGYSGFMDSADNRTPEYFKARLAVNLLENKHEGTEILKWGKENIESLIFSGKKKKALLFTLPEEEKGKCNTLSVNGNFKRAVGISPASMSSENLRIERGNGEMQIPDLIDLDGSILFYLYPQNKTEPEITKLRKLHFDIDKELASGHKWQAKWIWDEKTDGKTQNASQIFHFSKRFEVPSDFDCALLNVTADNQVNLKVNNNYMGSSVDWKEVKQFDITGKLKIGTNIVSATVKNINGFGGLIIEGAVFLKNGKIIPVNTDATWSLKKENGETENAFELGVPPVKPWGPLAAKAVKYLPNINVQNMNRNVAPLSMDEDYRLNIKIKAMELKHEAPMSVRFVDADDESIVYDSFKVYPDTPAHLWKNGDEIVIDQKLHLPNNIFHEKVKVLLSMDGARLNGKSQLELEEFQIENLNKRWQEEKLPEADISQWHSMNHHLYGIFPEAFKYMAQAGLHIHGLRLEINPLNMDKQFKLMEKDIASILKQDPKARFIIDLALDFYGVWAGKHPEEQYINSKGQRGPQSFSSSQWIKDATKGLKKFFNMLNHQYYCNRINLITLFSQYGGEWQIWGERWGEPDQSSAGQKGFMKYALEKYENMEALNKVWGTKYKDQKEIMVPLPNDLIELSKAWGQFRELPEQQRIVDYFNYLQMKNFMLTDYFAQKVREFSGGRYKTGVYFGYLFGHGWGKRLQLSGHLAMLDVYRNKTFDYHASPTSYQYRHEGMPGSFNAFVWTALRNGKMFFSEADIRTHLYKGGGGYEPIKSLEAALNILRREFVMTHVIGGKINWRSMDNLCNNFMDPEILREFNSYKKLFSIKQKKELFKPQIAVVYQTEAVKLFANEVEKKKGDLLKCLLKDQAPLFNTVGAPMEYYLWEEFKEIDTNRYKLVLFINLFKLSDDDRKFIDGKLKKEGKTLVWFYAPGLYKGKKPSLDNMEKLTGFKFSKTAQFLPFQANVSGKNTLSEFGLDRIASSAQGSKELINPRFYLQGLNESQILARYKNGETAAGMIKFPSWTSIYFGIAPISSTTIQAIARYSKIKIFAASGDAVYFGKDIFGFYSLNEGIKKIKLPEKCNVYEVFHNRFVARDADSFEIYTPKGETFLFYLNYPFDELSP